MAEENDKKTCFVIAPIGQKDSLERKRSDDVLDFIIRPAAEECGYAARRSDEFSETGSITDQIIEHLIDDELVIADLTGHNPNVFYELAIRHVYRKPSIQLYHPEEPLPFDVRDLRSVELRPGDLRSADACTNAIVKQIQAIEKDPQPAVTPIARALTLQTLAESGDTRDQELAELFTYVRSLGAQVEVINRRLTEPQRHAFPSFALESANTPFLDFLRSTENHLSCPQCGRVTFTVEGRCSICGRMRDMDAEPES